MLKTKTIKTERRARSGPCWAGSGVDIEYIASAVQWWMSRVSDFGRSRHKVYLMLRRLCGQKKQA